jgi:hypothetical protein
MRLKLSSFCHIASFNSSSVKNWRFLKAAVIHVERMPTARSTLAFDFGFLMPVGITTVP